MGLDSFGTEPPWIETLRRETEQIRNYDLPNPEKVSRDSWRFHIEGPMKSVVGKTHNHEKGDDFVLDFPEEFGWIDGTADLPNGLNQSQVEEIFAVVIHHKSPGKYKADEDDFIVLTESILEEKRAQGVRLSFGVDDGEYDYPENKYENCWDRFFKNLE